MFLNFEFYSDFDIRKFHNSGNFHDEGPTETKNIEFKLVKCR